MSRVTNKIVAEWKASALPVQEIARQYGVSDTTVYYHINKKHADRRREQWRRYRAKRRQDP
ncbi:helix-turn-helix domain-containing protein, partial [Neorhizobium sp. T786]|uniref:helix-turn-helix domain-containing protein n=1 Tax=Pseudorhizobium xiangyangii TaxID=2883104 RepID=UPI001CFFCACC